MSIALDRNGNSGNGMIQRSGRFIPGMPCMSIYDTKGYDRDLRLELEEDSSSSRSSSVGNNSDESNGSSDGEEAEVQSSFKGPLDTMDQLEEVLPVKRGISKFYNGKSKSFTSLADASSVSTVKELAKPVNPYNKKRKNLNFRDLKNNGCGIRRSASSSRGIYFAGETLSGSNSGDDSKSNSPSPFSCRPPLHPHLKRSPGNGSSDSSPPSPPERSAPWRSFSLSDLQCAATPTPNITGFEICSGDMGNNPH
ncbi:protein OXIDATIVE STRESS 3 LIKE 1-like [Argentina anserina]|uniref:protein OXIDATIVE STRESS 3 LIKE 1-like n=1 Tax=Argentina anserina TaxID=57926 RepID=UPI00217635CC|nr:protein OXIDATIVE STRESS 3 LIKE 1-like [Potentilla anserina]